MVWKIGFLLYAFILVEGDFGILWFRFGFCKSRIFVVYLFRVRQDVGEFDELLMLGGLEVAHECALLHMAC